MSAHDRINSIIDRIADRAYGDIMDRFLMSAREVIREEVSHEYADQVAALNDYAVQLDQYKAHLEGLEVIKTQWRETPEDLMAAAAGVAAAATAVERTMYSPAEKAARESLDVKLKRLREVVNQSRHLKMKP